MCAADSVNSREIRAGHSVLGVVNIQTTTVTVVEIAYREWSPEEK